MTSANQAGNPSAKPSATQDSRSAGETPAIDFTKLTPRQVSDIHRKADTDLRPESLHHTLGYQSTQAMPGNARPLRGLIANGSITTYNRNTIKQILTALKQLGLDDQTTG